MNDSRLKFKECETEYLAREDDILNQWKKFLSFQSISTDPAHHKDCLNCAEWLVGELSKIGFETKLLDTSKKAGSHAKPTVYAVRKGTPGAAKVLFYGHYDVQPVEPLESWTTPPFAAEVREGRMYARGAQDNKGQTWFFIEALRSLISLGLLNCEVKLLIEGEEESGSEGIFACIDDWKDLIQADVVMVSDTGAFLPGTPCITMGLRGLVFLEATLTGPSHDLHSGILGGVVKNPANELSKLLTSLHNSDGSIAVKGYYDTVREPVKADLELADSCTPPAAIIEGMVGTTLKGGEQGYSIAARRGFRPTIDINGMYSGHTGAGSKTIIPAKASAKISSRLVPEQDPAKCLDLLTKHLEYHTPEGVRLEITDKGVGGKALSLSSKTELIKRSHQVLSGLSQDGSVHYTWEGGSIPIVPELVRVSGGEPLLVGFGLEADHIHAPNESFMLSQFKIGFIYSCLMLQELSNGGNT